MALSTTGFEPAQRGHMCPCARRSNNSATGQGQPLWDISIFVFLLYTACRLIHRLVYPLFSAGFLILSSEVQWWLTLLEDFSGFWTHTRAASYWSRDTVPWRKWRVLKCTFYCETTKLSTVPCLVFLFVDLFTSHFFHQLSFHSVITEFVT